MQICSRAFLSIAVKAGMLCQPLAVRSEHVLHCPQPSPSFLWHRFAFAAQKFARAVLMDQIASLTCRALPNCAPISKIGWVLRTLGLLTRFVPGITDLLVEAQCLVWQLLWSSACLGVCIQVVVTYSCFGFRRSRGPWSCAGTRPGPCCAPCKSRQTSAPLVPLL